MKQYNRNEKQKQQGSVVVMVIR